MQVEWQKKDYNQPKWQVKQKLNRYPTKRWGHTATIYDNCLIIYGGKNEKNKESLYKINCYTFLSQKIQFCGIAEIRQSHSCTLINHFLYIWGGCQNGKIAQQCFRMNMNSKGTVIQENVPQKSKIPARQSHASVGILDQYILIYGGFNEKQEIVNEFNLFNSKTLEWKSIQINGSYLKPLVNCSLSLINGFIYLFGGEMEDKKYSNQLYQLKLENIQENTQECHKLQITHLQQLTIKPLARSSHCGIQYKSRYLIILGGQSELAQKVFLLNDIWSFDTSCKVWKQLKVSNNSLFKPRSNFTANSHNDKIIIFGGLIELVTFKPSAEFLVLSLYHTPTKQFAVCSLCQFNFAPNSSSKHQISTTRIQYAENKLQMNLSTLFKISSEIKNPFDAIGLILYSLTLLKITICTIQISNNICIFGQKGLLLNQQQFNLLCYYYNYNVQLNQCIDQSSIIIKNTILQQVCYNLKNCCSRLGNNFLFSIFKDNKVYLCLFNVYGIYNYIFNITSITKTQQYTYQQKEINSVLISKRIIMDYLEQNNIPIQRLINKNLCIIISSLRKNSNNINQLQIIEQNDSIQCKHSNTETLQLYLSQYFLQNITMKVILNNQLINLSYLQHQQINVQQQQQNYMQQYNHNFNSIYLQIIQGNGIIKYYKNNHFMGKVSINNVKGYIQLSNIYHTNITRTNIDGKLLLEQIIIRIGNQFLKESKKRKPIITTLQLQKQQQQLYNNNNYHSNINKQIQQFNHNNIQLLQVQQQCKSHEIKSQFNPNNHNHNDIHRNNSQSEQFRNTLQ